MLLIAATNLKLFYLSCKYFFKNFSLRALGALRALGSLRSLRALRSLRSLRTLGPFLQNSQRSKKIGCHDSDIRSFCLWCVFDSTQRGLSLLCNYFGKLFPTLPEKLISKVYGWNTGLSLLGAANSSSGSEGKKLSSLSALPLA